MIRTPLSVLSVLLAVLASLFLLQRHPLGTRLFRTIPLLVFCYFIPALLSNLGVIPAESELYVFIRRVLLPASLVLLVLCAPVASACARCSAEAPASSLLLIKGVCVHYRYAEVSRARKTVTAVARNVCRGDGVHYLYRNQNNIAGGGVDRCFGIRLRAGSAIFWFGRVRLRRSGRHCQLRSAWWRTRDCGPARWHSRHRLHAW